MIRPDLLRALRADHWERAEHGILFPRQRALVQGIFSWSVNGGPRRRQHNIITDVGVAWIAADTFPAALYGAIFEDDVTPTAAWTGAGFPAAAGELTSGTEGYVEATRPAWPDVNGAAPMEFNIRTATALTVCGFGILTDDTKGDTTGDLFSAMRFSDAPASYDDHDILDVYYAIETVHVPAA